MTTIRDATTVARGPCVPDERHKICAAARPRTQTFGRFLEVVDIVGGDVAACIWIEGGHGGGVSRIAFVCSPPEEKTRQIKFTEPT